MVASKKSRPGLILRLYVAGNAPNSVRAICNIRAICEGHFPEAYEIEIVDLLEQPLRGLDDGVIVTPTLLTIAPPPVQRVIGDLSDTGQVLLALGIR